MAPAVTVMANEAGQAILFREGGWGRVAPAALEAVPDGGFVELRADGVAVGEAAASAVSALSSSGEFFLGEIRDGVAVTRAVVRLRLAHLASRRLP